jgi:hypothetical protein
VTITTLTRPLAIGERSVTLQHTLTDVIWERSADTVILASSGIGRDDLFHALRAENPELELHLIGDAYAPRHQRHAMVDGARTGRIL